MGGIGDGFEVEGTVKTLANDTIRETVRCARQRGSSEGRENKPADRGRELHNDNSGTRKGHNADCNVCSYIVFMCPRLQARTPIWQRRKSNTTVSGEMHHAVWSKFAIGPG